MATIEEIRTKAAAMKAEAPSWGIPELTNISDSGVRKVRWAIDLLLEEAERIATVGLPNAGEKLALISAELDGFKPSIVGALQAAADQMSAAIDVEWGFIERVQTFLGAGSNSRALRPARELAN